MKARDIDVLILCGGKGTRLRSVVSDRPKCMADINGRPFLDILINYVARFGFKRFILCTGYMANYIHEYYSKKNLPLMIEFSEEKTALGTAGAVKNAEEKIISDNFLVLNGDSFCAVNYSDLVSFHMEKKSKATIVLTTCEKKDDYGNVVVDDDAKITGFYEKNLQIISYINTGIYLLTKRFIQTIPENICYSLEYDHFQKHTSNNIYGMYGFITQSELIDIGTSKRYNYAQKKFLSVSHFRDINVK